MSLIAKISITCFAASYSVALGLELTRFLFRSGVRGAVMVGFAGAGLLAHTCFLLHWWFGLSHAPLSSEFDWYLVAAWLLAATYLYMTLMHQRNPIGLFTLPIVLTLVAVAHFGASQSPFPRSQGMRLLGMAHGVCLLLGTVAVSVGFVAGLMYLLHAYRLKHKLPQRRGFELPSLEWLQRINTRAIVLSVGLLIAGFLTGLLLSQRIHGEIWWTDPVVITSLALAGWMTLVAIFNTVYKPSRQGRKIAYLTIASFVLLVFSLGSLILSPRHGATVPAGQQGEAVNGRGNLPTLGWSSISLQDLPGGQR